MEKTMNEEMNGTYCGLSAYTHQPYMLYYPLPSPTPEVKRPVVCLVMLAALKALRTGDGNDAALALEMMRITKELNEDHE